MSKLKKGWSRRDFLKTAGLAGAGAAALIGSLDNAAAATEPMTSVPVRPFGNTGIDVSMLSFGGSLNTSMSMLVLRQAVQLGVTYWDTANSYMGGRSEKAMGKYLGKYPEDRKKIFLVTKSHAWTLDGLSEDLDVSLKRLKTDYIDLFFLHSVRNISELDGDTKIWAEKKKADGKIRLFGFSTHSNMESCLLQASKLGWIDGIMTTYNYRLMHEDQMRRAVDACEKAGIGLTAMKTQGGGQVRTDSDTEIELAGRFLSKGFTDAQAKPKAVWENPQIASICSEMPNMSILMANVAAATDKTRLSKLDNTLLLRYAHETRTGYCSGCADICETAIGDPIPVADVMRCLMYARSYGDRYRAAKRFREIPLPIRKLMNNTDYSIAEQRCPRKMAISSLMRQALVELG